MSYLASVLIKVFSLSGTDTLDLFFDTFNGRTYNGVTAGAVKDSGLFGQAYTLFMYCAFAIIFLGMLYQIFKAFFGPLVQAESPGRVVLKSCFFAILAANAQNIVALVLEIAQIPYDAISSGIPDVDAAYFGKKMLENATDMSEFNIDSVIGGTILPTMNPSFWSSVLSIVLFFMLIKSFMALALELAERYLMLGILTIIAPLCIACGALKATEEVFKNWLSWVINGCIVMIFTTFFLGVFIIGFTAKADVPFLLLWIAWFKTGQKIDEHMNALGLKTAKTGGFGLDVMNAMQSGLPAALGAVNKIAGTGVGIPFAAMAGARGNGSDPSKSTLLGKLGVGDMTTGQKATGLTGLRNRAISGIDDAIFGKRDKDGHIIKGSGKGKDLLRKAETQALRGINAAKEVASLRGTNNGHGFHGNNSGLTHEQLQKMASGEMPMPAVGTPEFQNIAKDLAAMKGGEDFAKKLEDNGFKFNNMQMDKRTGDLKFSAEDEHGNKIQGTITEDPDKFGGAHRLTGDDGIERGFVGKSDENENSPMKALFPEQDSKEDENAANVIGANEENLEQTGTIGNSQGEISDKDNVGFDNNATDNDGNREQDFDKIDAATNENIAGNNIESTPSSVTDGDGNEFKLGEADENGIMKGVTEDGQEASFKQNEDGSISKIADPSDAESIDSENIAKDDNGNISQITDNSGKSFDVSGQTPDENGIVQGTAEDGTTANFQVDAAGNVSKMPENENISGDKIESNLTSATDSSGTKYDLSKNDDGTYTGTAKDGSTATFSQNEDGSLQKTSEQRTFDQSKGIQSENHNETISADNVTSQGGVPAIATDSRGVDYNLKDNGDGTFTGINAAGQTATFTKGTDGSLSMDRTANYATDMDGNKFEINSSSVHDSVKDVNGNVQNIDTSKGMTRNADNTISAVNENGEKVTLDASRGVTTCTDSKTNESFTADYSKGMTAQFNHDTGKMQVSAYDGNGDKHSINGGNVNLNGNNLDMSKGISVSTDSNGNRTYQATNTDGKQFSFTDSDIRNAKVSGGTTSALTTKTADISNSSGKTSNTMSFTSPTNGAGSIVQTTDGKFIQTTDGRRYDKYGNESAMGGYMQTKGENGIPQYVPVMQTASGQIPTYSFKENQLGFTGDGAGFKKMVGGKLENFSSDEIKSGMSQSYVSTDESSCTHYNHKGKAYKAWESDQGINTNVVSSNGKIQQSAMSQRYVALDSDRKHQVALDMSKSVFDEQGNVVPSSKNEKGQYVADYKNGTYHIFSGQTEIRDGKEIPVSTSVAKGDLYRGKGDENSHPISYIKVHDSENGTPNYFNYKDSAALRQGDSYFNGVRVNMDLNKGSATPILDQAKQPTGQLLYKNQGEEYILHPAGTDVSKCNGTWLTMPNGKNYFAEPNPANYMTSEISKLGLNPSQEKYNNIAINTKSAQAKVFCQQFGIPEDAKSVRLNKKGTNISITYEQNGQNYCITSSKVNGVKQEGIVSKNTGNISAYRSTLKKGQSAFMPLTKAIQKTKAKLTFQRNYRGNK